MIDPGARVVPSVAPSPPALTEPFWTALEQHTLVVQRCDDCGTWRWSPQLCCPRCLSERTTWTPVSGRGELYSCTVVRRSPDPARFPTPYLLAIVRLDEGPHLLTTLVDCDETEATIGQRVVVAFRRGPDGGMVYPFVLDPSVPDPSAPDPSVPDHPGQGADRGEGGVDAHPGRGGGRLVPVDGAV